MLRRRHIDADPGGSRLRNALAAVRRPFRAIGWAFRERLLWPIGDLLRTVGELLKWPFQRLWWSVERRLIWPFRGRLSSWGYPRRIAGASALVAIAVGAAAFGIVLSSQEKPAADPQLATIAGVAEADVVQGAQAPSAPTLQGAPPVFGVNDGVKVANAKGGKAADTTPEAGASDQPDPESKSADQGTAPAADTAATSSDQKAVPAGPDAMKVARRFANAFVFYEVGKRPQRAKQVFQETATPELANALTKRPPRLPANAKVPKARVLNLVPGPRHVKAYTISASLLRVGVTSELRLQLKKLDGVWAITDVRG